MRLNPGKRPWERGHLARLNTRVGLRRVVHCRPPAGCGRDARAPGNIGAVCAARFAGPMSDLAGNFMSTRGTMP